MCTLKGKGWAELTPHTGEEVRGKEKASPGETRMEMGIKVED